MKKITVFGATGMVGTPVTKELVKAGYEVTVLVRNIEKAKLFLPKEVRFVKGDLNDKVSIAEALKGAEMVYLNLSIQPTDKKSDFLGESGGLDNILAAAKQLNTQQIAYLSALIARDTKKIGG